MTHFIYEDRNEHGLYIFAPKRGFSIVCAKIPGSKYFFMDVLSDGVVIYHEERGALPILHRMDAIISAFNGKSRWSKIKKTLFFWRQNEGRI